MDTLKAVIYDIVDSDLPNKFETYKQKYPHHFNSHPRLMRMACEPDLCVATFKSMFDRICAVKSQMDNAELSKDDAEKQIGQSLAEAYLPV
jgi:hypothetical protein